MKGLNCDGIDGIFYSSSFTLVILARLPSSNAFSNTAISFMAEHWLNSPPGDYPRITFPRGGIKIKIYSS